MTLTKETIPPAVQLLWGQLTVEQRNLVTQLIAQLAGVAPQAPQVPIDPAERAKRLEELFADWETEEAAMTPEEVAAAEAEWQAIEADLDEYRLSNRPLFP
jgi:hypothetical protein